MPRSSQRTTSKPAAFELSPDRAFVLHLDARAQPPRRVAGRVEHVTSGQVAHVTCLRELVDFLAKVLRAERRRAEATLAAEPCESDLASSARGSLNENAARSAAQSTLRGREGEAES